MEQFQKGENEEGHRDGDFIPIRAQAARKDGDAQRRLHPAVDGDGEERGGREEGGRALGRAKGARLARLEIALGLLALAVIAPVEIFNLSR